MIHASVIGAGPMGSSVAGELALHGIKTRLYDVLPHKATEAVQELTQKLPELIQCGLMDKHCEFASLIKPCTTLRECVQDAEIVFEAIVENAAVKRAVFEEIAALCPDSCIIASNTLTLDVGVLTEHIPFPERALAVRFLHPVFGVQGVEITPTRRTSTETKVIVESFLTQSLGKTPFYRTTGTPRYALSPHTEQVVSLSRTRSDPPRGSHRASGAQSPQHATWSNSCAVPRAEQMEPQFATWAHHSTSEAYRLPDHLYRPHLAMSEAATRDRAGPGGPGAVGAGPLPMFAPPAIGSSGGSTLVDGRHGGPGAEGTGRELHIPFVPPNPPASFYQGAGGVGGMGTGSYAPNAVQRMSQGFIPEPSVQRISQGFIPEPSVQRMSQGFIPEPSVQRISQGFIPEPSVQRMSQGFIPEPSVQRISQGFIPEPSVQRISQGFIPERSAQSQTMSQGFIPEGPGGPGAFRSTPLRSDHAPSPTRPMPSGPGGPGAFGTPMDVSDAQQTNDTPSCDSNQDGGGGEAQACVVCMDAARNALLCPCHHFCVCAACAKAICNRRGECPVCRGAIESVIPVFVP